MTNPINSIPRYENEDIQLQRAVTEATSVLMYVTNTRQEVTYFNQSWLNYRGRRLNEELGFGWIEGVHYEDYDHCYKTYTEAFENRQHFSMIYRIKKSDGTFGWIQDDGAPHYDADGVFRGYIGSCFDITANVLRLEKMENHIKLLESTKSKIEKSLKAGNVGIWDWDIEEDLLTWDNQMYHIYGNIKATQKTNIENWKSQIHPDEKEYVLQILDGALQGLNEFNIEFRICHTETRYKYIKADAIVIRDKDEKPIRMLGTHLDITDLKLAKLEIQCLERRNKALLDHSPMCHMIVDVDFKVRYINENGLSIFRLNYANSMEALNYPFEFFSKDSKAKIIDHLICVLESGIRQIFEVVVAKQTGEYIWVHQTITPIFKEQTNTIDYLSVVCNDISEEKETQEQLKHREKLDAIGQLAGGIAHDFNNNLSSIFGFAELILQQNADEPIDEYASKILLSAENSRTLTRQLLNFSRKQKLDKRPTNIHEELLETMNLLERTVDKAISIKTDLNADNPVVFGDKTQLQSAFLNVAINAIDAIRSSGKLVVSTYNSTTEDDRKVQNQDKPCDGVLLHVCFEDTGSGISAYHLKKIFEPFYTTKPQGEGTGMGLASVYGTIMQHGGTIDVESKLGVGTKFEILLPVFNETEHCCVNCDEDLVTVPRSRNNNARILVIDDEALIRDVLKDALTMAGYEVTLAENGRDGIDFYKENISSIDLIILDLSMPEMSGYEIYRQIKDIDPLVNIVIASGYSADGEKVQKLSRDFTNTTYLEKPFNTKELHAVVELMLESL